MAKKPIGTPFGQASTPKPKAPLKPTVTIGGVQAGYKPTTSLQPTVTIGGAQAGYKPTVTPNYITGEGIPGASAPKPETPASTTPVPAKTITGTTDNGDGTYTVIYSDGSTEIKGAKFTAVPGSTGIEFGKERTLAKDTFANTLALLFGAKEASQPWVAEMYGLVSGFYKSGSTIDEALNLGLYEAKSKNMAPAFTKRFKGVFALEKKKLAGEVVEVPTIAEYFKSQTEMASIIKEAGLGDIATEDFLGDVIGAGNSVLDVGNLISDVFNRIDNAPKALKDTLKTAFPQLDRVSLAKALLTGEKGAAELGKQINTLSVLSAAGSQGISIDLATAGDISARNVDYGTSLTGFGQVKELQRANTLAQFSGGTFTQQEAIGLTFAQDQAAKEKLEKEKAKEFGRFQSESGLAPSALRGMQNLRQQI